MCSSVRIRRASLNIAADAAVIALFRVPYTIASFCLGRGREGRVDRRKERKSHIAIELADRSSRWKIPVKGEEYEAQWKELPEGKLKTPFSPTVGQGLPYCSGEEPKSEIPITSSAEKILPCVATQAPPSEQSVTVELYIYSIRSESVSFTSLW